MSLPAKYLHSILLQSPVGKYVLQIILVFSGISRTNLLLYILTFGATCFCIFRSIISGFVTNLFLCFKIFKLYPCNSLEIVYGN